MDIFKGRMPARDEMLNALAACILPVFFWSIINVLYEVPAWILRLSTWDLLGVIAYTQAFALVESVVIFLLILALALVLPRRFFREKFLALTATIMTISTIWLILAHYNDQVIRQWGLKQFLLWFLVIGFTIMVAYILVLRFEKVGVVVDAVYRRLSSLSFFYLFIGVIGLTIVVVRNILEAL